MSRLHEYNEGMEKIDLRLSDVYSDGQKKIDHGSEGVERMKDVEKMIKTCSVEEQVYHYSL